MDGSEEIDKISHIHPCIDLTSNIQPASAIAFPIPYFRCILPPGKQNQQRAGSSSQWAATQLRCRAFRGLHYIYACHPWGAGQNTEFSASCSSRPIHTFSSERRWLDGPWPTVQLKSFCRPEIQNDAFSWASSNPVTTTPRAAWA